MLLTSPAASDDALKAELRVQNVAALEAKLTALKNSLSTLSAEYQTTISNLEARHQAKAAADFASLEAYHKANLSSHSSDLQSKAEYTVTAIFDEARADSKATITTLFNELRTEIKEDAAKIRAEIKAEPSELKRESICDPTTEAEIITKAEEVTTEKRSVQIAIDNRKKAEANLAASLARFQAKTDEIAMRAAFHDSKAAFGPEGAAVCAKSGRTDGGIHPGSIYFPPEMFVSLSPKSEAARATNPTKGVRLDSGKSACVEAKLVDRASPDAGSRVPNQKEKTSSYPEGATPICSLAETKLMAFTDIPPITKSKFRTPGLPPQRHLTPTQQPYRIPPLKPISPVLAKRSNLIMGRPGSGNLDPSASSHVESSLGTQRNSVFAPAPIYHHPGHQLYNWNSPYSGSYPSGGRLERTAASPGPNENIWYPGSHMAEPRMFEAPVNAPVKISPAPVPGRPSFEQQSWETRRQVLLDAHRNHAQLETRPANSARVPAQELGSSSSTPTLGSATTQSSEFGAAEGVTPCIKDMDPRVKKWLDLLSKGPFELEELRTL